MWEDLIKVDRDLFRYLNNSWIGEFDSFWIFVTQIETWIPLFLFIFYLFFKKIPKPKNFIAIALIFIIAALTLFLTHVVKNYVGRLRPNNEPLLMDSIRVLQTPENFSFWSGHSAVSFAVATFSVILLLKPLSTDTNSRFSYKWLYLIYLWPITFAFSRIFVGVHYPADITVGMIVGILLGFAFAKAFIITVTRFKNRQPL
jgi:undecaprenyl-diphosphatase